MFSGVCSNKKMTNRKKFKYNMHMKINKKQIEKIKKLIPIERRAVKIPN